jgi:glycine/sarcosine/betaine reductase complex component A
MDMESQAQIKKLAEQLGRENLVVVLGASDIEGAEIAAETLTVGDPSFAGPLAGVSLGLPIYHILEPDVKAAIPEDIYEQSAGIVAMIVDTDEVAKKFRAIRESIAKGNG